MLLTDQQIAELAAQNQQLRLALDFIGNNLGEYALAMPTQQQADVLTSYAEAAFQAMQLPDLASKHLNRVKAEALRSAADEFDAQGEYIGHGQQLRQMADAIEKGEGNATD